MLVNFEILCSLIVKLLATNDSNREGNAGGRIISIVIYSCAVKDASRCLARRSLKEGVKVLEEGLPCIEFY